MADNPTTIPFKYWRDSEVIYLPHWRRYNGTTLEPLVNSADGLFPKPIVKPVAIGVLHFSVWKTYTDADYKNELNATNSDAWREWEPGQAWVSRIITEDEEVNGVATTRVDYIIRCTEFGWDNDMIQMGYFHKDGTDETAFTTSDGIPYIGTLDAAGAKGAAENADDMLKRRIAFGSLGVGS